MLQHIKMLRIYAINQSVTSTHTTKVFGRRMGDQAADPGEMSQKLCLLAAGHGRFSLLSFLSPCVLHVPPCISHVSVAPLCSETASIGRHGHPGENQSSSVTLERAPETPPFCGTQLTYSRARRPKKLTYKTRPPRPEGPPEGNASPA